MCSESDRKRPANTCYVPGSQQSLRGQARDLCAHGELHRLPFPSLLLTREEYECQFTSAEKEVSFKNERVFSQVGH